MKCFNTKKTTQELIGLGMALHGDKDAMETRIRGVFSRQKSARIASMAAAVLALALVFACFTTACQPVVANAAAEMPVVTFDKEVAAEGSLLTFGGYAKGTMDGNKITVTDAKGQNHEFTWVDEGIRKTVDGAKELSDPIPEGTYATPAEAALHAAETAVTIWGDAVPSSEIHINMYTGDGLELVYYGIGFDGTPFESVEHIYGYADAVSGTLLHLDYNYWGQVEKKYGGDFVNGKMRSWQWDDARYTEAHTADKALATAMELIRTCFPTGEIVPKDMNVWDAGSHTDGEQILWAGGYVAVVDAYIRMDMDPCYYVQVAVPLEEGAEPCVTIFGCYPLGWDYCCNQIHDPAVLREELAEMEAIRNGIRNTDDTGEPASTLAPLSTQDLQGMCADRAESLFGTTFRSMTDEWKEGDDPAEYNKIFLVRVGAYLDDGYESSDPLSDAAKVDAAAKRGSVLRFDWDGQFRYAMYLGNGQMAYADAEDMTVRCAYVADWLNDKEGKPGCTCSILTWR